MLLQGPVGPFFRDLQRSFVERGFDVIKINFNGGDLIFSAGCDIFNFRGSPTGWSAWLNEAIAKRPPEAIVLFGDRRPYHIEALRVAAEHGMAVWCLEEGYIRPDYVTCERDGNNARSPLRHGSGNPDHGPARTTVSVGNSFGRMAAYGALHAVAQFALARRFRGNIRHRRRRVAVDGARWVRSLIRKVAWRSHNHRIINDILSRRFSDYYVVALQVHDDLNLLHHGNGWTMPRLIGEATRWFADHAPPGHRLLFKVHPLDRGHLPYRRLVAAAAHEHGCSERVSIVDDCPIGPMIRGSDGLITVNSTSGLIALRHAKPLLVLGDAAYSRAELETLPVTTPAGIESFWRHPKTPREEDVRAFFDRMERESLINGSFYLPAFRASTAEAIGRQIQGELASDELASLLVLIRDHYRRNDETGHERLAG